MSDAEEPDEEEPLPELCDLCGAVITNGSEVYTLVPDSSALHAHDPKLDGRRLLTACSTGHLAELQEQYRRRPFVDEELWAGKITRALEENPQGLDEENLIEETGLDPLQIQRAVTWQNEHYRRWREQYGEEGPDPH